MDHDELIAALEAVDGPSRDIDLSIMRYAQNIGGPTENALHYTGSLDAALTLVPDGFVKWAVCGRNSATVGKPGDPVEWSFASTPAIALCIAALRARGAA